VDDGVTDVLASLVKQVGPDIAADPRRLRGYLSDLAGNFPDEIAALVAFAERGGVSELRSWPASGDHARPLAELEGRLSIRNSSWGQWALRSWSTALGVDVRQSEPLGNAHYSFSSSPLPVAPSLQSSAPYGPQPGRGKRLLLVLAILFVVGGGVAAAVAATAQHGSPSPQGPVVQPPTPDTTPAATTATSTTTTTVVSAPEGQAAAQQHAALLQQSNAARNDVVNATSNVGSCKENPGLGVTQLQTAISMRHAVLIGLNAMQFGTLHSGTQLLASLTQAQQSSIAADTQYIGWMNDIEANGCPINNTDPAFQAASAASAQATIAKTSFVASWNPVAATFGLPTYMASDL
jgi:hypothetical protein